MHCVRLPGGEVADNTQSEVKLLRGGQSAAAAAVNSLVSPSHTEAPPTAASPQCFHVRVSPLFAAGARNWTLAGFPTVTEYQDKSRNFNVAN